MVFRRKAAVLVGFAIFMYFPVFNLPSLEASPVIEWNQKMRSLLQTLTDLLVDISSDEAYNSPKNFKRIEKNAENLSKLAHGLKDPQLKSVISDPSLKIVTEVFDQEARHAYQTLIRGNRAYAREVLRSMTGYCAACHTQGSSGPRFANLEANEKVSRLRPLEKAAYYTASRQFDRASTEYKQILSDSTSSGQIFDFERAARAGLAIAVRVDGDPDRALSIANQILIAPKSPQFLKQQATQWKQSLAQWKSEKAPSLQSEDQFFSEASRLIEAAAALQKYPADHSADILYLRASRVLHDLLNQFPQGKLSADALYLSGVCYEVLQGLGLWHIHEFYYLVCIERRPHSEISAQCYRRYEESVYLGYSGSAGTELPPEIRQRLSLLEKMSRPESNLSSQPKLD